MRCIRELTKQGIPVSLIRSPWISPARFPNQSSGLPVQPPGYSISGRAGCAASPSSAIIRAHVDPTSQRVTPSPVTPATDVTVSSQLCSRLGVDAGIPPTPHRTRKEKKTKSRGPSAVHMPQEAIYFELYSPKRRPD